MCVRGGGVKGGRKHMGNVIVMWIVSPQVEQDYQQWSLPLGTVTDFSVNCSLCIFSSSLHTLKSNTFLYLPKYHHHLCMWGHFCTARSSSLRQALAPYGILLELSGVTWVLLCTRLQAWEMCQEATGGWLRHLLQGHQWADCGMHSTHMYMHVCACMHNWCASHGLSVTCIRDLHIHYVPLLSTII